MRSCVLLSVDGREHSRTAEVLQAMLWKSGTQRANESFSETDLTGCAAALPFLPGLSDLGVLHMTACELKNYHVLMKFWVAHL